MSQAQRSATSRVRARALRSQRGWTTSTVEERLGAVFCEDGLFEALWLGRGFGKIRFPRRTLAPRFCCTAMSYEV